MRRLVHGDATRMIIRKEVSAMLSRLKYSRRAYRIRNSSSHITKQAIVDLVMAC